MTDNRKEDGEKERTAHKDRAFLRIITCHPSPHIQSSISTATYCVTSRFLTLFFFSNPALARRRTEIFLSGERCQFYGQQNINRTNCSSIWQRFLHVKLIPGTEIKHFLSFKRATFFESLIKRKNPFPRERGSRGSRISKVSLSRQGNGGAASPLFPPCVCAPLRSSEGLQLISRRTPSLCLSALRGGPSWRQV